jgi:hypothetical protein
MLPRLFSHIMVQRCWELCLHALALKHNAFHLFPLRNDTTATPIDYNVHNCKQCIISYGFNHILHSILQFQSAAGMSRINLFFQVTRAEKVWCVYQFVFCKDHHLNMLQNKAPDTAGNMWFQQHGAT